ncbi:MAG: hypothetical protein PVH12_02390 [Candidatus Bathyarchaeota archaeon]|jgi:hypothetical protein
MGFEKELRRQYVIIVLSLTLISIVLGSLFYYSMVLAQGPGDYDPWYDVNDDGTIDMRDIGGMARKFGTSGTPITKASVEYDSDWIDITDNCGQYFNVTHNQNSTDIIVDITGKTTPNGGIHKRYLDGADLGTSWNQTYGGSNDDNAMVVVQTNDGGYAIIGHTFSYGAGQLDIWLIKTDSFGNIQWNRTFGGTEYEYGATIIQTADGGYIIGGQTRSFGAGQTDPWLIKTDSFGNMQWNKTCGGIADEGVTALVQANDGGYAIIGNTDAEGGVACFLIKTDAMGNHQWNQTYKDTYRNYPSSGVLTSDGGYVMAGVRQPGGSSSRDFQLIKVDSSGNHLWNKTYGGSSEETAIGVVRTVDGGYAIIGATHSFGVNTDAWLVKTDATGNMQWNKNYGGTGQDVGDTIIQTFGGGYAITGQTTSFGAGSWDAWLIKVDSSGNHLWNQTYGGSSVDIGSNLIQTTDGGFAIASFTSSFGAGGVDFWLIKTDTLGSTQAWFKFGLAWTDSAADTITLYRGSADPYWNYVQVRIWKIKE